MRKELTLRAKFTKDHVKQLGEPRFSYKHVHHSDYKFQEKTLETMGKDEPFFKMFVVDSNFNFVTDLV